MGATITSTSAATASNAYSQTLDQNDFLKLMVAQLSAQDPLNPVKDTDFAAQMAQFSSLEQSQAMQKNMATLQANSLLGRQVEVKNTQGLIVKGEVTGVTIDGGTPKILVGGQTYELSQITSITPLQTPVQNPAKTPSTESHTTVPATS